SSELYVLSLHDALPILASAKNFPGRDYDLIATFDALHDMGDPAGAARHALQALTPDGTWMIVEPYAGDRVEDNLNPIGRAYYAADRKSTRLNSSHVKIS